MALKRKLNWQTELHNFIQRERGQPFAWGVRDCALFAADAIKAVTGVDIADDFRTGYASETAAFSLVKAVTGGSTVADAAVHCAQKHGLAEYAHPLMAQRGDLVIVDNAGQGIAGIVGLDGRHAVSVGEKGIIPLLITKESLLRAWKV